MFGKNTLADWLRLWYLDEIVAPPSVMWCQPDLKRGAKISWQGLLGNPSGSRTAHVQNNRSDDPRSIIEYVPRGDGGS